MNRRYEDFVHRQVEGLPEGASYQYVSGKYLSRYYSSSGYIEKGADEEVYTDSLIDHILTEITNNSGPSLILIEAAAGYGKTCTAYELIHKICASNHETLPLYIELSRNREATIFKHILQNEIELQFQNIVTSEVVLYQISKGRIPVVIDGFDELLSKDTAFGSKEYHKVEGILNTIFDLLKDNAKIIITSRKTALFNSEEYFTGNEFSQVKYNLMRVSLSEPSIEDWLNNNQLRILEDNHFPMKDVSNPVLLSYIKNLPLTDLKDISNNSILVKNYFELLLNREIARQRLIMNESLQMRIFMKLVRFMCEFNIKAEDKSLIKSLIQDYNSSVFTEYIDSYPYYPKPTFDDLAETLSNHVLLDRKSNGLIGFINDFIFGTLIGYNLVQGKFKEHYSISALASTVNEDFASLAITAYRVQSKDNKEALCSQLDVFDESFSQDYHFQKDVYLRSTLSSDQFKDMVIKDMTISDMCFSSVSLFKNIVFSSCYFIRCKFLKQAFEQSGLIECKLVQCCWIDSEGEADHSMYLINCSSDNGLEDSFYDRLIPIKDADDNSIQRRILSCFFKNGHLAPMRKISAIKSTLGDCDKKELTKELSHLCSHQMIAIDGDLCFIQKEGISFYNKGN